MHDHYVLKHSRLSIVFQCCFILFISVVLYVALDLMQWVLATILLWLLLYFFRNKPKIQYLYLLDQSEWSIQYEHNAQVYRVMLTGFTDHYFYIVIYVSDPKIKNIVIWKDQMDIKGWKSLKIRAKLN